MSKKLSSEEALKTENDSEFDESEMSEISVEDVIDCSVFTKEKEIPTNKLISEHSVEYARLSNEGNVFEEKVIVFPKIKSVPNQVFVKFGHDKTKTEHLTSIVSEDNEVVCEAFFWSGPIDNSHETKGLSEMTSWKVKGQYVSEPLNYNLSRNNNVSSNGTQNLDFPKNHVRMSNIPKSAEELIAKKRLINARYKKNLKKRKRFWRSQNEIPIQPKQASMKPISKRVPKQVQPYFQKPKQDFSKSIPKVTQVISKVFKPKVIAQTPISKPKQIFQAYQKKNILTPLKPNLMDS